MAKKTKTKNNISSTKDVNSTTVDIGEENLKLANILIKRINKKAGVKVANKLSDMGLQSNIKGWVSIGNQIADIVISNTYKGGIPFGRITEVSGLEGCVTEDTLVEIENNNQGVTFKEVESLLNNGIDVKVRGLNNKFNKVTKYINKGILNTYEVILEDNYSNIKVSNEHKFFTEVGWLTTRQIKPNINSILCEDGKYRKVNSISFIGKHKIVDMTVENEHAYFGNRMYNHNSGKSLLCVHMIKDIQRQGGIAVYFDTEAATSPEFWEKLGVDPDRLISVEMECIEDIYGTIDEIILSIREKYENKPILIIIDSITSASSKATIESETHELKGYATHKARVNSSSLKMIANNIAKQKVALVITSQLRQKLGASLFEDPYITSSGGVALSFYASLRLRLRSSGKIKEVIDGVEHVVGVKAAVTVTKSRFGTMHNQSKFNIYFSSGVENVGSWLEELKKYKLVNGGGAGYFKIDIINKDGEIIAEDHPFRSDKGFKEMLIEHPDWKDHLLHMIKEKIVMKVRNPDDYDKENLLYEKDLTMEHEEKMSNKNTVTDAIITEE